MAKSGQKVIPFSVREAMGTVDVSKHGTKAEQPKTSTRIAQLTPDVEQLLGPVGVAEWKRIMKHAGTLRPTETMRGVFIQYCTLWARLVEDKASFKAADHTQLRLCAVELGFTPSAMTKIRGEG